MTARIQLQKNSGRESQGAWRQDELIGVKPPVVKPLTLTLTVDSWSNEVVVRQSAGKNVSAEL
jgi:hypothetical protein